MKITNDQIKAINLPRGKAIAKMTLISCGIFTIPHATFEVGKREQRR